MKKQFTLLLFSIVLLTTYSCGIVSHILNEGNNEKTGVENFEINENKIILKAKLDGVEYDWLYDSGFTSSALMDTIGVINKKTSNLGSIKLPDGNKLKSEFISALIENDFMQIENKMFSILPKRKKSLCGSNLLETGLKGIIGSDVFSDKGSTIEINFEENQLKVLDEEEIENYKNAYGNPIKAEFKNGHFYPVLSINEKEYSFFFDTGYSGFLMLDYANHKELNLDSSLKLEGVMYQTIVGETVEGVNIFSTNNTIDFEGIELLSVVESSSTIKDRYNMGLKFIKNFNWLIDYSKKEAYIKLIDEKGVNQDLPKVSYKAHINDKDELYILSRNVNNKEFKVGSIIQSVDGQQVNSNTICEILKTLNATEDWNTLDIEFKE